MNFLQKYLHILKKDIYFVKVPAFICIKKLATYRDLAFDPGSDLFDL